MEDDVSKDATNKKPTAKQRTIGLFTGKTELQSPNWADGRPGEERRSSTTPWRKMWPRVEWQRDGLGRWYVEIPRRKDRPGEGREELIAEVVNEHGIWTGRFLDPEKGWSLPMERKGFLPHATYAVARELWGRWKVLVGDYDPRVDPALKNDS